MSHGITHNDQKSNIDFVTPFIGYMILDGTQLGIVWFESTTYSWNRYLAWRIVWCRKGEIPSFGPDTSPANSCGLLCLLPMPSPMNKLQWEVAVHFDTSTHIDTQTHTVRTYRHTLHTCMCTHIMRHLCICTRAHICTYAHTLIRTCTYTHIDAYMDICTHSCMQYHAHMHKYTRTHTHKQTKRTDIETYTCRHRTVLPTIDDNRHTHAHIRCTHIHLHTHAYTHRHAHACTSIYIYIYIYTDVT